MKRKNLLRGLAVFAVCCVGGATFGLLNAADASAEEVLTTDKLLMDGASVRFRMEGETDATSTEGIRFETRIAVSDYNTESGLKNITEIGTLFIPETEGVALEDMVIGKEGVWKEVVYGQVEGEEEMRNGAFAVKENGVNYYAYRAYMYGIPAAEYFTSVQARGYVIADGVTYYSEAIDRSIAEVATLAKRDTKSEQTDEYKYEIAEGVWSPYTKEQLEGLDDYYVSAEAPTITVSADTEFKYHVGDVADLSEITAADWLGNAVEVSLSVNGGAVELVDGTFTVTGYDDYTCTVTATDSEGRTAEKTYTIYVYEENELEFFNNAETLNEEVVSAGGAVLEYSTEYTKDGNGSLKFTPGEGSSVGMKLIDTANFAWDDINGVTFWVYNPTEYEYRVTVVGMTPADGATLADGNSRVNVFAKPGQWTKGSVSASMAKKMMAGVSSNYLSIYVESHYNGTNTSAQWAALELYFDAFTIDTEYDWSQTLTGSLDGTIYSETGIEELEIDGVKEQTSYVKLNSTYIRTNALFEDSASINWAEGNKLTFKAYNDSNYDLVFSVGTYASLVTSSTAPVTRLENINLQAGDTDEIVIYKDSFDSDATPYIGFYFNTYENGAGVGSGAHVTQRNDIKINFFDFAVSEGVAPVAPTSDDYLWATAATNGQSVVVTDQDMLVDGSEYSLNFRPTGGYPSVVFGKKLEKVKAVNLQVYNSVETLTEGKNTPNLYFYAAAYDEANAKWTNKGALMKNVRLEEGKGWKQVSLNTSTISGEFYIAFATVSNWNSATENVDSQYSATGLYFDGFEEIIVTEDELWTNTANGRQGSFTSAVNTDATYIREGSYSVNVKPNGTWNTVAFTNAANIDWEKVELLTFDVYNPTAAQAVFGSFSSWGSFVVDASGWTTVKIEDVSIYLNASNYFEIALGHGSSVTIDGVKTTNPASGAADGLWDSFKTKGFYFDNFVITYKA